MPAISSAGLKLQRSSTVAVAAAAGQPLDPASHRGQHPLAVELTERDEPETRADQQRRGRVEIGRGRALGLGAATTDGRAEHRRVMSGRPIVVDGARQAGEKRIIAEAGGDAQRLTAHLTTRRPELRDRLHRVETRVERDPFLRIVAPGDADGDRGRRGVGRSGRALEVRRDEHLEIVPIANSPVLHVGLEPERVGEAAGRKESVRELQQASGALDHRS